MPDTSLSGKGIESREDFDFKKSFDIKRQFSHNMEARWRTQPQVNAEELRKKFEEGLRRFPWRKEEENSETQSRGQEPNKQISEKDGEVGQQVDVTT